MQKTIASLFVKLKGDSKHLNQEMNKAKTKSQKAFTAMKQSALMVAGAMVSVATAIVAITLKTAKMIDEIVKAGKQLGVTAQFLGEMDYSIQMSGGSLEDFKNGLRRMARSANDANNGLVTYKRSYDALGISLTDNYGAMRDLESLLMDAADAFASMTNNTTKAAISMEIFGRGGASMIPLLNEGSEGIREMRKEARELGYTMSAGIGDTSEELIDATARVKMALTGLKMKLVDTFGDDMVMLINKAAWAIAEAGRWATGEHLKTDITRTWLEEQKGMVFATQEQYREWLHVIKQINPELAEVLKMRKTAPGGFLDEEYLNRQLIPGMERAKGMLIEVRQEKEYYNQLTRITGIELDKETMSTLDFVAALKEAQEIMKRYNEEKKIANALMAKWKDIDIENLMSAATFESVAGELEENLAKAYDKFFEMPDSKKQSFKDKWAEIWRDIKFTYTEETVPGMVNTTLEEYSEMFRELKYMADSWQWSLADSMYDALKGMEGAFSNFIDALMRDLWRLASMEIIIKPLFDMLSQLGTSFIHSIAGGGASTTTTGGINPSDVMWNPPYQQSTSITVEDYRTIGDDIVVEKSMKPGGGENITIIVKDNIKKLISDGSLDGTLSSVYGITRKGVVR